MHEDVMHEEVERFLKGGIRVMSIAGYSVPVANLPYFIACEACKLMAERYAPLTFAACYWETPEGRAFTLRSTEAGFDVSKIAEIFGGHGGRRSAGFRMPIGWEGSPF